jgi:APA family basic amino acid/polyamine antiporter
MVLIKIGILVLFIVLGLTGWNSNNLADFAPFGFGGVTAAAGIIFFSYIKIDAVSTAGEQVKNPHRSMPIAIITALLIVTALYVLVSLTAVAAQPHDQFQNQEAGLAAILEKVTGSFWSASLLAAGAVISIFSVTLVVIYGRTRILFAMARDGMLPELFHRVNPRTHTPVPNTLIVVTIIAVFTGFIAINFLGEMNGVENLVAFAIFSIAVIVLWRRESDLPRPFKVPGYPVTPILSILGCLWIIKDLRAVTLIVFVIWVAIAIGWYFLYGIKHSHLGRHEHVGLIKDEPVG